MNTPQHKAHRASDTPTPETIDEGSEDVVVGGTGAATTMQGRVDEKHKQRVVVDRSLRSTSNARYRLHCFGPHDVDRLLLVGQQFFMRRVTQVGPDK